MEGRGFFHADISFTINSEGERFSWQCSGTCVSKKLLSGFLTVSILTVVVGAFGTYGLLTMKDDMADAAQINSNLDAAAQLMANVYTQQGNYHAAALNLALDQRDDAMADVEILYEVREEFLAIYNALLSNRHSSEQDAYLVQVRENYAIFSSVLDEQIVLFQSREKQDELRLGLVAVTGPREDLLCSVSDLMDYIETLTD